MKGLGTKLGQHQYVLCMTSSVRGSATCIKNCGNLIPNCDLLPTPDKCYCFSLAGSTNPLDDLIGDILDSTDSTNLLGGIEVNSTTPPQSQQAQQLPMIIPPTPLHSLRPTAGEMVSPGMFPHGVMHSRATMLPTRPTRPMPSMRPMAPMPPMPPMRPMYSTGWGYPRYGGGGGQYGTMPGQYVNQIQMARPGGMEMNMAQPALPHVISSYNPATGAGVRPFSKLGAAVPQQRSPPMYPPTLRQQGQLCVSIIL